MGEAAEDLSGLADDAEIDRELAARSLHNYVEMAFPHVVPGHNFVDGFHIGAVCEHLQAVSEGEITRLLINMPPGCMKSLLACVFWPSWEWTLRPSTQQIYASYSQAFSRRDALKTRRLIESNWYRQRWGDTVKPSPDEWSAFKYGLKAGGWRLSTSVRGQVTGDHGHHQVCDDPVKPQDVFGSLSTVGHILEAVRVWWAETMTTRLLPGGSRTIIMQRLHENDLSGQMLLTGDYDVLCLPMRYDKKVQIETALGFEDPRTEPEQLLWPQFKDEDEVAKIEKGLGTLGTAAQMQQMPSPRGGNILKRAWFRYYYKPGFEHLASETCIPLPDVRSMYQLISGDCAFKGGATGSYVALQTWGKLQADAFLLDQVLERMDLVDTCKALVSLSGLWPRAFQKLIEDAANGPAVYSTLRKQLAGIVLVPTGGGKEARANAVAPIIESGNVYLPHPEMYSWVGATLDHYASFPTGTIDDDVDAMTHALVKLYLGENAGYVEALMKLQAAQ